MRLENTMTGSEVRAWFEQTPAPWSDKEVLIVESASGRRLCRREDAPTYRVRAVSDAERRLARELGYHFARER